MSSENKYLNSDYQGFFENSLSKTDPDLFKTISDELKRQQNHIELIASENIVSQAVLEAQGSVLTNKYAEGYPGKRYYDGCEHVDKTETLAIERLKMLFDCKFANVQPHSGAQANGAVFLALLNPGDTFLGMSLNSGGHITHGLKIFLILLECLPPSNFVFKKILTQFKAFFFDNSLEPNVMIFASLCNLDNFVDFTL